MAGNPLILACSAAFLSLSFRLPGSNLMTGFNFEKKSRLYQPLGFSHFKIKHTIP